MNTSTNGHNGDGFSLNGNGAGASILKPFNLLDHLDKLTPSTGGKYHCPVCTGNDFSVNKKTGAYTCHNNGCTGKPVRDSVAPLTKADRDRAKFLKFKPLTTQEKEKEVFEESIRVECQVDDLIRDIRDERSSYASATVRLSVWCKQFGQDAFAAKALLKEKWDAYKDAASEFADGADGVITVMTGDRQHSQKQSRKGFESFADGADALSVVEAKEQAIQIGLKRRQRLDLKEVIHIHPASWFNSVAKAMPTAPEALLATHLAISSSCIGTSSVIKLESNDGWIEPSVLWTMIVSDTGTLKTPSQKRLIKPLTALQETANIEYKDAHQQWKKIEYALKKEKRDDEIPAEPKPREYWIGDSTMEAIAQIHSENPRGFLRYQDEVDGFFDQMNKYRKGDDEQNWMSLYTGGGIKVNRISKRLEIYRTAISMTGTIQPETLQKHLRSSRDTSGMMGRWLICGVPLPMPYSTRAKVPVEFGYWLRDHYEKLSNIKGITKDVINADGRIIGQKEEPIVYGFDAEADDYWCESWNDAMNRRIEKETDPAIRSVLSKQKGSCARIALNLHLSDYVCGLPTMAQLRALDQEINPPKLISLDVLKRAIAITEFFITQSEIMYGVADSGDKEDSLAPIFARLEEISKKFESTELEGWLTPRIARNATRMLKNAEHAKEIFSLMHENGIGELDASGRVPKWRYSEPSKGASTTSATSANSQNTDEMEVIENLVQCQQQDPPVSTVRKEEENPFPEPKQPEPKTDSSIHYSDENIANLADLVRAAIESGCPEEIDSLFESTPIKIRAQIKELVMMQIDPGQSVTVEQEEVIITEHDGFKIGDRVKLSLDRLTPEKREVRIKEGGIEHDGEEGEVVGFVEDRHYAMIDIQIRLDNGTVEDFGDIYVNHGTQRNDAWLPVG